MAGHVQGQRSPAAAGFDHRLAGAKLQLAAHEIELGPLRRVERHRVVGVVGTGVDHLAVEPHGVEVVTQIVMMVHVAAGRGGVVGARQRGPPRAPIATVWRQLLRDSAVTTSVSAPRTWMRPAVYASPK